MPDTNSLPPCPNCTSALTSEDGPLLICPECAHEWSPAAAAQASDDTLVIRDANGNLLADGDTVTIIKDLKLKGSSQVLKVGTRVKNIRLVGTNLLYTAPDGNACRWALSATPFASSDETGVLDAGGSPARSASLSGSASGAWYYRIDCGPRGARGRTFGTLTVP